MWRRLTGSLARPLAVWLRTASNGRHRLVVLLAVLLFAFVAACSALIPVHVIIAQAQGEYPVSKDRILTSAILETATGSRRVSLPHILDPQDFQVSGSPNDVGGNDDEAGSDGGIVRYRLELRLNELPEHRLAVLVPKMSLSGDFSLNGVPVARCGHGYLRDLRCLHQPQLFSPPSTMWRTGSNYLDFHIYATNRQSNGLSAVRVGQIKGLVVLYKKQQFWRSTMLMGLAWMAAGMGVMSLGLAFILRRQSVYLWFGLTALTNALVTLNGVIQEPVIPIHLFNWLVFVSRMVSVPFFILTALAIFGKSRPWITYVSVCFAIIAPAVVWFSDNNLKVVLALYVPWLATLVALMLVSIRWAAKNRTIGNIAATVMQIVVTCVGLFDWMKTGGIANFENVYLLPYAFGGAILLMGIWLVVLAGSVFGASQLRTSVLEQQLSGRVAYEVTRNIPIGTFSIILPAGSSRAHFLFVSERFLSLTGLSGLAGKDLEAAADIVHPDDRERWENAYKGAIARFEPLSIAVRLIVGQSVRWVAVESRPRQMLDGSTIWEGILVDETDKVAANAAAERARAAYQESQIQQSRLMERAELLRDLHDGFGSRLAGLKALARRGDLTRQDMTGLLDEISSDLHLVIDTLGNPAGQAGGQPALNLNDALADMRHRLNVRLGPQGRGLLKWHIRLEGKPALEARTCLQILRVVQEGLNNALKYAQASRIDIGAVFDPATSVLQVWVRDNGVGLPDRAHVGHGLNNMRQRAREIGATIHIGHRADDEAGTEVLLQLPIVQLVTGADVPAE